MIYVYAKPQDNRKAGKTHLDDGLRTKTSPYLAKQQQSVRVVEKFLK